MKKSTKKHMEKMLRSIQALILAAGMAASLTACGGDASGGTGGAQGGIEGVPVGADGAAAGNGGIGGDGVDSNGNGIGGDGADGNDTTAQGGTGANTSTSGLQLLCTGNDHGCHTQEGYYYLENEAEKLSDGSYGSHLMYMDFAALQEVYLCSDAGCGHDTADCAAVLPYEDFIPATTLLFPYKGKLYLFSKDQDRDGSMETNYAEGDAGLGDVEAFPSILYRANLDGTGREKAYTFDASLTVEDFVMGDENGLYLVTKKLTSKQDGLDSYTHSQDRNLVFLDPEKGELSQICSMDFDSLVSWRVAGCYGRTVVLQGIDYGREVSDQELFSEDGFKELYENSSQVIAALNLDSGQLTEKYRMSNSQENSFLLSGNALYVSFGDGSIKEINLDNGQERSVCSQPGKYYYLDCIIGDKLCCSDFSGQGDFDRTYYFIDRNTGEISHSGLVNKSLGWSLEFRAVLDRDVLVVYDYEATPYGDGSYEITLYQHGLISQEDLFAGNDNFRKIDMIGTGW